MRDKIIFSDKESKFLIEKEYFYNCIEVFDRLKIRTSFFVDKGNGYIEISYKNINDYIFECLSRTIDKTLYFKNNKIYKNIFFINELDRDFNELKILIKNISEENLNILSSKSNMVGNELKNSVFELYNFILNKEKEEYVISDILKSLRICTKNFSELLMNNDDNFYKSCIEKLFNYSIKVNETQVKLAKLKEFFDYKNQMVENLKCFFDKEKIEIFKSNYDFLLNSKQIEIEKLENFCNEYNNIIKNEYKKTMSDVNSFKNGIPFNFICHSIDNVNFQGDFKTQFVSTSYINQENYDLYKSNFGFIFDPKDIVWASDKDSFIINQAQTVGDISRATYMPLFMHPKLVMEKNKRLKKLNEEKGLSKKVYNEIVIDGFNPIGIFCLTNGSKELNDNYCSALKLKEQFPNLPLIDIDLTLYKGYDRKKQKNDLIYSLNSLFNYNYLNNESILDKYDLFFDKFIEMKKNNEFEIEKIKQLYLVYTNELLNNNIINCQSFNENLENNMSKKII